jgi:hypothetical protein
VDKLSLKDVIEKHVLPKLDEFIEADTAFFLHVEYEGEEQSVNTLISPAPPMDLISDVMEKVAEEISKEFKSLPSVIVACEKVRYMKTRIDEDINMNDIEVDLLDSGVVIVALDASTAEGIACLYKLPSMEEASTKSIKGEDGPPYTMLAISSFMHEVLIQEGLVKEVGHENNPRADVKFRFSRN